MKFLLALLSLFVFSNCAVFAEEAVAPVAVEETAEVVVEEVPADAEAEATE